MPRIVSFGPELMTDIEAALQREWLETNGLGGFASSTVTGTNTRRYHGLLTAATKPPVGRAVLLSRFEETLVLADRRIELGTNCYPGTLHPRGYEHLVGFRLDPYPVFEFEVDGLEFEKRVFLVHGENTVVVQYAFSRAVNCRLELRPLLAYRDYHHLARANNWLHPDYFATPDSVILKPYEGMPALYLSHGARAEVTRTAEWYYRFTYERERERGLDLEEDLFNPCVLSFDVSGADTVSVVASTEPRPAANAETMREAEERRRSWVASRIPDADPFVRRLVTAADAFIVERGEGKTIIAGYPWFSDWGRDTMIALPGLTLSTGRMEDARSILREFAKHMNRGMLPNRFPDAGEQPEYNTVDATLWMFEATRQFLATTDDRDWVLRELYPALKSAIEWHIAGTRYGIRAGDDGLLRSGEPGSQLTWMDAKIGDSVVTPRHGKAVEIQALWYNALRVTQALAAAANDHATERTTRDLADLARRNFLGQFWNAEADCLYDVVDGDRRDASIRPNQIFAVSLGHTMLTPDQEALVVAAVERNLLTPMGLRSLAPSDPAYRPHYEGGVVSRDSAYHQGTVWPWLIGPFVVAYLKVNRNSEAARERARTWLEGFDTAILDYGLGFIGEVADGEWPHRPGGCIAQAWSIAEILRATCEIRRAVHVAQRATGVTVPAL